MFSSVAVIYFIYFIPSISVVLNIFDLVDVLGRLLPHWDRASHLAFSVSSGNPCSIHVYPLILHFYVAKLGYAGVYLFFWFLLQNIDCWYSIEPPRRGGSNVYPQSMF